MKIIFVSNYFNHHQRPISNCLSTLTEENFWFVETAKMREERKKLGYGEENIPTYVLQYNSEINELLTVADVIITGSIPEKNFKIRLRKGKLILRYAERPLKNGGEPLKYLPRLFLWNVKNPFWQPIYLLCASAYTVGDYRKFAMFKNKAYKWGYFPELRIYENIEKILCQKKKNSILWAGRFISWKHPEYAVDVASRLKQEGIQFELNMIGNGEMYEDIKKLITQRNLEDCVHLLGSMNPNQVRNFMEKSQIYLFTSNQQEGWGVVLNESMNSACAVVADHLIGSVPYLIQDQKNGMIYKDGDVDGLYDKTKWLLTHNEERNEIAKNAYKTILEEWNAKVATERLINLITHILAGEKFPVLYESGPCSKAQVIKDNWF